MIKINGIEHDDATVINDGSKIECTIPLTTYLKLLEDSEKLRNVLALLGEHIENTPTYSSAESFSFNVVNLNDEKKEYDDDGRGEDAYDDDLFTLDHKEDNGDEAKKENG